MTMIEVLLIMAAVPFVAYLTVKLSTYAFYRGRQIFQQQENRDGESKSETREGIGPPMDRDA